MVLHVIILNRYTFFRVILGLRQPPPSRIHRNQPDPPGFIAKGPETSRVPAGDFEAKACRLHLVPCPPTLPCDKIFTAVFFLFHPVGVHTEQWFVASCPHMVFNDNEALSGSKEL